MPWWHWVEEEPLLPVLRKGRRKVTARREPWVIRKGGLRLGCHGWQGLPLEQEFDSGVR